MDEQMKTYDEFVNDPELKNFILKNCIIGAAKKRYDAIIKLEKQQPKEDK